MASLPLPNPISPSHPPSPQLPPSRLPLANSHPKASHPPLLPSPPAHLKISFHKPLLNKVCWPVKEWRDQFFSVHISNINPQTTQAVIRNYFQECGKVMDVFLPKKAKSYHGFQFGFVRYKLKEEALRAVLYGNSLRLDGFSLFASLSHSNPAQPQFIPSPIQPSHFNPLSGKASHLPAPSFKSVLLNNPSLSHLSPDPNITSDNFWFNLCAIYSTIILKLLPFRLLPSHLFSGAFSGNFQPSSPSSRRQSLCPAPSASPASISSAFAESFKSKNQNLWPPSIGSFEDPCILSSSPDDHNLVSPSLLASSAATAKAVLVGTIQATKEKVHKAGSAEESHLSTPSTNNQKTHPDPSFVCCCPSNPSGFTLLRPLQESDGAGGNILPTSPNTLGNVSSPDPTLSPESAPVVDNVSANRKSSMTAVSSPSFQILNDNMTPRATHLLPEVQTTLGLAVPISKSDKVPHFDQASCSHSNLSNSCSSSDSSSASVMVSRAETLDDSWAETISFNSLPLGPSNVAWIKGKHRKTKTLKFHKIFHLPPRWAKIYSYSLKAQRISKIMQAQSSDSYSYTINENNSPNFQSPCIFSFDRGNATSCSFDEE